MPSDRPYLALLGGTELRGPPRDASDRLLGQTKAVALLAYLALSPRGRYQRRDRLVGMLWPELDQQHARAALRKVLHSVRGVVGEDAVLARGDEELALDLECLGCDAVDFIEHIEAGRPAQALELYHGELLDGFILPECGEFGLWLDGERTAMQERSAAAAMALSRKLEVDEEFTMAATWARRAVRFSWSDERVLRRSLEMLHRLGDRAGALRLFDEFARRLRQEFDAEPSSETLELIGKMR